MAHDFEAHRCAAKPGRFSIRRYRGPRRGWTLAQRDVDPEWVEWHLSDVTWEDEGIIYCPWCGERLADGR